MVLTHRRVCGGVWWCQHIEVCSYTEGCSWYTKYNGLIIRVSMHSAQRHKLPKFEFPTANQMTLIHHYSKMY